MTNQPVLYDQEGRAKYLSIERVRQAIVAIDELRAYRNAFEIEDVRSLGKHSEANMVLSSMKLVTSLVPNEIRAVLPPHFGLSNHELGKLEEKCRGK